MRLLQLAMHETADFLERDNIGIDLAEDRQYPLRIVAPVAADARMDIIGHDAKRCRPVDRLADRRIGSSCVECHVAFVTGFLEGRSSSCRWYEMNSSIRNTTSPTSIG